MIFDGNHGLVMYMRSPLFDRVVPTGKWVKMDVAKLAKKQGMDLGTLMNANQADPSQSLRMLMASSGARVTGAERIRGVETTHYAFNIDLKKLAHDNKAFRQLTEKTGSISAPAEAWVDKQGRVRRLSVTMTMGAALGTPITMSITDDLYDFGEAHLQSPRRPTAWSSTSPRFPGRAPSPPAAGPPPGSRSVNRPSACVTSLGMIQTLLAVPWAICGSTCRYW